MNQDNRIPQVRLSQPQVYLLYRHLEENKVAHESLNSRQLTQMLNTADTLGFQVSESSVKSVRQDLGLVQRKIKGEPTDRKMGLAERLVVVSADLYKVMKALDIEPSGRLKQILIAANQIKDTPEVEAPANKINTITYKSFDVEDALTHKIEAKLKGSWQPVEFMKVTNKGAVNIKIRGYCYTMPVENIRTVIEEN